MKIKTTISHLVTMSLFIWLISPKQPKQLLVTETVAQKVWLDGEVFATEGEIWGVKVVSAGLTLVAGEKVGSYQSPPLLAPLPFNALFPHWLASGGQFTLSIRTQNKAGEWSDWWLIAGDHDLSQDAEMDEYGGMVIVPAQDRTHTHFQYTIQFTHTLTHTPPTLNWLELTFVNSTGGPSSAELQPMPDVNTPITGYPKPPVIPRSQWCVDPACNYSEGLEYHPVSHLIVHHTISGGSDADYADAVRAIWYYHTFEQDWGDVGYHYLIDPNGVIYEGHLGGDDVIGIHASQANTGSMAASLIGDYSSVPPSNEMLAALADLLAWKADQRNIDPFDAGTLPNTSWGLPKLMGHRDVYGGTNTQCPGEVAHDWLPWLRQEVANRISFVSPHLYYEEWLNGADSSFFTKSAADWHDTLLEIGGCGSTRHAYFAFSTTNPAESSNWGIYRPDVPATGLYQIDVYVPYCDTGQLETDGAYYEIHHAEGVSNVMISQNNGVGLWISLGRFPLNAGNSNWIYLTNLTTDTGLGVWFDAIRLRPAAPTAINQQPAPESWVNDRDVTFQWGYLDAPIITSVELQVSTNDQFTQYLLNQTLPPVTQHVATFSQDYSQLYWRVWATTNNGQLIVSPATRFGLDSTPPTSAVYSLAQTAPDSFVLQWSGSDTTSGISGYHLDYWAVGDNAWTRWLTNSSVTSATFVRPDSRAYWFRSQAVDNAGNLEPANLYGDISTEPAPPFPVRHIYLPLHRKN